MIYKIIQGYIKAKRLERSFKSNEQYEWLCSIGMYDTAIWFNEWGQLIEEQAKQYGSKQYSHDFQTPNIKWYV